MPVEATCEEAEAMTLTAPVDSGRMLLEPVATEDEAIVLADCSSITAMPEAQLSPRQPMSREEVLGLLVFLLQLGQRVLVKISVVTLPTGQLVTVGAQLVMV